MYLLEKVLSSAGKISSDRISSDLSQRAILYGTVYSFGKKKVAILGYNHTTGRANVGTY